MTEKPTNATTREQALRVARMLGCQGAHEQGDGWMPCGSPEEYVAIKKGEEEYLKVRASRKKKPQPTIVQRTKRLETKSNAYYENRADALAISRARGCSGVRTVILAGKKYYAVCEPKKPKNGWENLNEKPITGIATLTGGGIVTGSFSGKSLGPRIGDIGEFFEGSEFDGDGDGFRQGRDGKDNVPVVASTVVDAVKRAGRVSDLVKPTDDLMEARKAGRPWAPLMIEHQPKEWLDDFKKLADDVAKEMISRAKKGKTVRAEWKKKYGWAGTFSVEDMKVIPEGLWEENRKYLIEGFDNDVDGVRGGFYDRINDLDSQVSKRVLEKLEEARKKAYDAGKGKKFDLDFKTFIKNLDGGKMEISPVQDFIRGRYMVGLSIFAGRVGNGWLGDDYEYVDQFALAEKAAKQAVANPNKRVVVQMHSDVFTQMLADGKMKNFFQAKRNFFNDQFDEIASYDKWQADNRKRFYLKARLRGEQNLMGLPAGGFEGKNRPIYAMFMPDGVGGLDKEYTDTYGGVGVVLKHSIEERSTFTAGDSLGVGHHGVSPINDPGMGLGMINGSGFSADGDLGKKFKEQTYVEAQIMGGVSVNDISYIALKDDSLISEEIKTRLKEMGIPVVIHDSVEIYKEPPELASKAESKDDGYVLLATSGNRKLFAPNRMPEEGDLHGMMTVDGGKRQRVDNIPALMKFGNWEFVGTGDTETESTDDIDSEKSLEEKGFVNFVSRSTDPDVFSNPESARIRARNLGCIGIRRYTAGDGKTVWLPCTNVSDFNRLSGIRGDNSPVNNPRRQGSANRKKSSFDNGLISFKGVPKAKKKPPTLTSDDINNLAVRVRQHNAKSTSKAKTNLRDLKIVYVRGLLDDGRKEADKRVSKFLSLLNSEKPKDVKYSEDNDLLPLEHPWRNRKTSKKFAGFTEGEYGVKYSSGCCPEVVKRYRAK